MSTRFVNAKLMMKKTYKIPYPEPVRGMLFSRFRHSLRYSHDVRKGRGRQEERVQKVVEEDLLKGLCEVNYVAGELAHQVIC
jgi:hypothetical protein